MDQVVRDELAVLYERVNAWFERDGLRRMLGLGEREVEEIALDWLAKAGKRWRPFLAVCMFRAVGELDDYERQVAAVAVALECIHKASLIYDDIQDDDDVRYGEPTVHTVHGVPLALTASLLLIGHGYRLLAECEVEPERRARMLALATEGHCQLCLGQGTELSWMRRQSPLAPEEVLDIFRLKTAPSFDVVFRLPLICGGLDAAVVESLRRYCEIIGTAYQINDDLDDFHGEGDVDDLLMGRPSIVLAYAYEAADDARKKVIADAWCGGGEGVDYAAVKELLVELRAPGRALEELERYRADAVATLASLGRPDLEALLSQLSEMIFTNLEG